MKTALRCSTTSLILLMSACTPPLDSARNYCAPMSAPDGLDFTAHPDAARFQGLLDAAVRRALPGVALQIQDPDGLWIGASGQCDLDANKAFAPLTRSRIGSVSKVFTATAVMLLVEEGRLGLDDPIADHLDAELARHVVNSTTITVRQLLNHSSGLPREPGYVSAIHALDIIGDDPKQEGSFADYVAALRDQPALFEPGQGWSYSNFGYALLGLIMEQATGQGHAEVLRSRLFEPLGLADTFYDAEQFTPAGLARGYMDFYGDGGLTDASDWDVHQVVGPGGAIVSTVHDMGTFLQALFGGQVLSEASLEQLLDCSQVDVPEGTDPYGFGISCGEHNGRRVYSHAGELTGYMAAFLVFPEQQTIATAVFNGSHGVVLEEIAGFVRERLPALVD